MPQPSTKPPSATRWLGIGLELAAAVAGFTLAGYWVDRHFGHGPWGVLVGLGLGLIGGMYNLIRESLAAARAAGRKSGESKESSGDREL
jgi:F0F1-type ATP synthase assembly protein I